MKMNRLSAFLKKTILFSKKELVKYIHSNQEKVSILVENLFHFALKILKTLLMEKKIKFTQELYTQKKMLFCKFQSMVECPLKGDGYIQQQAHVNSVQKKHIN
ncbi:hypothetical protein VO68_15100 [Aeromonas salmonicida]|nr:hypothetical protein VO68_15100 [Aeromonas salmonicida]